MEENKLDLILVELKNIFNQIEEKFEQVDNRFEQIDKRFEQIDNKFEQIDKRFEQIDKRIDNLSAEMGAVHRTLFKLDVETQKNFRLLSDAIKLHNDKQLLFEKQLYRLNDQLDNTTFRVSVLEDDSL